MKVFVLMREPCPTVCKLIKGIELLGKGNINVQVISEFPASFSMWKKLGYDIHIDRVVFPQGCSWLDKINNYFIYRSIAWKKVLQESGADKCDIIQTITPDYLPVFARKYTEKPIAHHFREIQSIFPHHLINSRLSMLYYPLRLKIFIKLEQKAIESANILSFDSEMSLKVVKDKFTIDKKMMVIKNAPLRNSFPETFKPKLSAATGKRTIVYHGHMNVSALEFIQELCSRDIEIHLYPLIRNEKIRMALHRLRQYPNLHIHDTIIGYKEFIYELSQYDFGLLPPLGESLKNQFFNTYLPCKVFDYVAAGLPVISGNYVQIRQFIEKHQIGYVVNTADDILNIMKKHYNIPLAPITVDEDIEHLLELYASAGN